MNEWQFTSDVAKWITEILQENQTLPFAEAYCEGEAIDSRKRRDLTITDKNGRIVLTGEVKLPGKKEGATPYSSALVTDARAKAQAVNARFFFTWNVNECVLWETALSPEVIKGNRPDYKRWSVTNIYQAHELEFPIVQTTIKEWLKQFLQDVKNILLGVAVLDKKSPDEKFIDSLEAALATPISLTIRGLNDKYSFSKKEINNWMRDELGFLIEESIESQQRNLENAAKYACYVLINKLIFYEALLKRYNDELPKLIIPKYISTGEELRNHFNGLFSRAKQITDDYETVFGEDTLGFGSRVPFYNDGVVDFWRTFVEEIHEFDFSKLDYEIIGNIFERLISPEERQKYGQFYTRVEIVDLMNSFAIRTGEEKIMDPACGGGTFLVRAYARKRELAPYQTHAERLQDIYGVDVSSFATHLTTINLATRDLIDDANYPQVARTDYFDIAPNNTLITLPNRTQTIGLGKTQRRNVKIPQLDAIVGNPPYIRQEEISRKDFYDKIAQNNGAKLTKRSDIHCYFWPHSYSFLKNEGYLCFLTSSQWLDTEYGFKLQEWILKNFEIVAILESQAEPWFVGARVATTVTILRRQIDEQKRLDNVVRFVQLFKPLRELLGHDGTTAGAVVATNRFRDEILSLTKNSENSRYQAHLVPQNKLWQEGVQLGYVMAKSKDIVAEHFTVASDEYYGGKWGIHLRAPKIWFDLQQFYGQHFIPLGHLLKVKRGITTGNDKFFYPKDITDEALLITDDVLFSSTFGVSRNLVESGIIKIVKCGEQYLETHAIESEYLQYEVHSLMDINNYFVSIEDCKRFVFLAPANKIPPNSFAQKYINWGVQRGFDQAPTVRSRNNWYDITNYSVGQILWSKSHQYRHSAPTNELGLPCNCNLYNLFLPDGMEVDYLAGILNSSFVIMSKFQYGRPVGVEGNLKTEVMDVNIMLIPDPHKATEKQHKRIIEAFRMMKKRPVIGLLSDKEKYSSSDIYTRPGSLSSETELTQNDRYILDDAILEMIGIPKNQRETYLSKIYQYLNSMFQVSRTKEKSAQRNKTHTTSQKKQSQKDLILDILEIIKNKFSKITKRYEDFLAVQEECYTYEILAQGKAVTGSGFFERFAVQVSYKKSKEKVVIETAGEPQRDLLALLVNSGLTGFVRIPVRDDVAKKVGEEWESFLQKRSEIVQQLINERTSDVDLQNNLYQEILQKLPH